MLQDLKKKKREGRGKQKKKKEKNVPGSKSSVAFRLLQLPIVARLITSNGSSTVLNSLHLFSFFFFFFSSFTTFKSP